MWYGLCYGEAVQLISRLAVTLSVYDWPRDSKNPVMDVRQWPLRASRTRKGYSPFGRLVRSELSIMWIFSY
ncbi:hypothetical protein EMIT0P218_10256 [Pseudomonas sp. IT-P218]